MLQYHFGQREGGVLEWSVLGFGDDPNGFGFIMVVMVMASCINKVEFVNLTPHRPKQGM
jgi:hypothetical protein